MHPIKEMCKLNNQGTQRNVQTKKSRYTNQNTKYDNQKYQLRKLKHLMAQRGGISTPILPLITF